MRGEKGGSRAAGGACVGWLEKVYFHGRCGHEQRRGGREGVVSSNTMTNSPCVPASHMASPKLEPCVSAIRVYIQQRPCLSLPTLHQRLRHGAMRLGTGRRDLGQHTSRDDMHTTKPLLQRLVCPNLTRRQCCRQSFARAVSR